MSYIGNQPSSMAFLSQQFSGDNSTTSFTLPAAPANPTSIFVMITGVVQDPTTYAVVGNSLNFSAAPPAGTGNISVRYMGIPASGVVNTAYRTVTEFTATAGQTTFTPPSYTVGFISVFLNGVRLGAADYTATNGTSIVLATGALAGALVTTESFYVSSILNGIPATPNSVLPYIGSRALAASQMPAGSVLQVVQGTYATGVYSTSGSWVDSGLQATITPTSATSKILITANYSAYIGSSGGQPTGFVQHLTRFTRNGTALTGSTIVGNFLDCRNYGSIPGQSSPGAANTYMDSPASTSALTYKMQFVANLYLTSNVRCALCDDGLNITITLMEIAA